MEPLPERVSPPHFVIGNSQSLLPVPVEPSSFPDSGPTTIRHSTTSEIPDTPEKSPRVVQLESPSQGHHSGRHVDQPLTLLSKQARAMVMLRTRAKGSSGRIKHTSSSIEVYGIFSPLVSRTLHGQFVAGRKLDAAACGGVAACGPTPLYLGYGL